MIPSNLTNDELLRLAMAREDLTELEKVLVSRLAAAHDEHMFRRNHVGTCPYCGD